MGGGGGGGGEIRYQWLNGSFMKKTSPKGKSEVYHTSHQCNKLVGKAKLTPLHIAHHPWILNMHEVTSKTITADILQSSPQSKDLAHSSQDFMHSNKSKSNSTFFIILKVFSWLSDPLENVFCRKNKKQKHDKKPTPQ